MLTTLEKTVKFMWPTSAIPYILHLGERSILNA